MKGHYLQLTLPEGKENVRREYVELAHEDETVDEAIERWVTRQLGARQRNRAKAATRLKVSILHARITRPTSYLRERAEAQGLPFPTPVPVKRRRSRRRA